MKKSLIAAVVLASASFASTAAMAATVGNTPQVLDLTDGSGFFGDTFAMSNNGNTFADRFTFSVAGTGMSLDAIISSVSHSADTGLDITGHFLEQFVFGPLNRPLPPARVWLLDRLAEAARL